MLGPRPVTPAVRARAIADVLALAIDGCALRSDDDDTVLVYPLNRPGALPLALPADTDGLPRIASRAVADTVAEMARGPGAGTAIFDGLHEPEADDDAGPLDVMTAQMRAAEAEGGVYELHGAELSAVLDLVVAARSLERTISGGLAAADGSDDQELMAVRAAEDASTICRVVRTTADRPADHRARPAAAPADACCGGCADCSARSAAPVTATA